MKILQKIHIIIIGVMLSLSPFHVDATPNSIIQQVGALPIYSSSLKYVASANLSIENNNYKKKAQTALNKLPILTKAYIIIGIIILILIVALILYIIFRLKVGIIKHILKESSTNEYVHQKKFNTIISALPVGCAICDKDGIVEYINQSMVDACGIRDVESHLSKRISLFDDPLVNKTFFERIKQGEDIDISTVYDLNQVKRSGYFDTIYSHKILVDAKIRTIKDSHGEIENILVIMQNLTEFSKQRDKLEKFKQNLSLAADAGNLTVWEYDFDNNIVIPICGDFNTNSIQSIEAFRESIHHDDSIKHTEALKTIFKNKGGKASCQVRVWNDEIGDYEYTAIEMVARESAGAKVSGIVGISHKIAHESLIEANYNRLLESLKLVVSQTKIDVWLFNIEDQQLLIFRNGVFEKTNITFSTILVHIHNDDTEYFHSTIMSIIDGDIQSGSVTYKVRYFTQVKYLKIRCDIEAIKDANGRVVSLVATCTKLK